MLFLEEAKLSCPFYLPEDLYFLTQGVHGLSLFLDSSTSQRLSIFYWVALLKSMLIYRAVQRRNLTVVVNTRCALEKIIHFVQDSPSFYSSRFRFLNEKCTLLWLIIFIWQYNIKKKSKQEKRFRKELNNSYLFCPNYAKFNKYVLCYVTVTVLTKQC